jgi:uncharacterized membrane protein HdeD (DUF308 family)
MSFHAKITDPITDDNKLEKEGEDVMLFVGICLIIVGILLVCKSQGGKDS